MGGKGIDVDASNSGCTTVKKSPRRRERRSAEAASFTQTCYSVRAWAFIAGPLTSCCYVFAGFVHAVLSAFALRAWAVHKNAGYLQLAALLFKAGPFVR